MNKLTTLYPIVLLLMVGCASNARVSIDMGEPPCCAEAAGYAIAQAPLEGGPLFDPVVKKIEGWTVHIEPSLLEGGKHAEVGGKAIKMLANHLQRIAVLMPDDKLATVQKLEIWIENKHPQLGAMQYHPSQRWLEGKGYDSRLAKKYHIPRAAALYSRGQLLKHPAVVLHELAHAYHDQVLGFDDARVIAAYESAMQSKLYDKVMLYTGQQVRHYAATNHKEFFAEATEAYFYRNDFYPFVAAELKAHDPKTYKLMETIWGPLR